MRITQLLAVLIAIGALLSGAIFTEKKYESNITSESLINSQGVWVTLIDHFGMGSKYKKPYRLYYSVEPRLAEISSKKIGKWSNQVMDALIREYNGADKTKHHNERNIKELCNYENVNIKNIVILGVYAERGGGPLFENNQRYLDLSIKVTLHNGGICMRGIRVHVPGNKMYYMPHSKPDLHDKNKITVSRFVSYDSSILNKYYMNELFLQRSD